MDAVDVVGGPDPRVFHFTHIDNLASIVRGGLHADAACRERRCISVEAGDREVKARRRDIRVPVGPGGVVADYVPFYFAPRSPMLYKIARGSVPTYPDGQEPLVYLVTRVGRLFAEGCDLVLTGANAAVATTDFGAGLGRLHDLIDWELMRALDWRNTLDDPHRMQRRMAELLVHRFVPWRAIAGVAVRSRPMWVRTTEVLAAAGSAGTYCDVRTDWYFEGHP